MTKIALSALLIALGSTAAFAEKSSKPCTSEPKDKWLKIEAIEKIVADHGYKVAKAEFENACAEIYARDAAGKRVELFLDPVTGNPADGAWKAN